MCYWVTFFRLSASESSSGSQFSLHRELTNRPPCRVLGGRARTARQGELSDVFCDSLQGTPGPVPGRCPGTRHLRIRRLQERTGRSRARDRRGGGGNDRTGCTGSRCRGEGQRDERGAAARSRQRSEEHTSELQSLMRTSYPAFC